MSNVRSAWGLVSGVSTLKGDMLARLESDAHVACMGPVKCVLQVCAHQEEA